MATFTTYHNLEKPGNADPADNIPLNDNFDIIDKGLSDIGDVKMTSLSAAENANWMICDGSAISRTTYSELNSKYSAMGYPYGNGDGSTTFNIPDAKLRIPIGVGTGYAIGADDGLAEGSRAADHDHAHTHTGSAQSNTTGVTVNSGGTHTHGGSTNGPGNTTGTPAGADRTPASGTHTHTFTTNTTGSSHAHGISDSGHTHTLTVNSGESDPHPFIAFNFLVRVL